MASMRQRLVALAVVSAVTVVGVGVGATAASADSVNRAQSEVVTTDGLRFRTWIGTDQPVKGLLYEGDEVEIISTNGDGAGRWDEVRLLSDSQGGLPRGSTGWVSQTYLSAPTCSTGSPAQCLLYGSG